MKYFIITYGCQMNHSDSERIAALLKKQGHKPAKKPEQAGLIVINACSVRQSAIDRVFSKIHQIQQLKTKNYKLKTILTGCILESDKKKLKTKVNEFWNPDKYFTNKYKLQYKESSAFDESRTFKTQTALIPIMTGCNNFCSYCVVPYTRGREKSRPAEKIIKEIKALVKNGVKEIILLGQNVNSYNSEFRISNFESNSNYLISKFKNSKLNQNSKFIIQNSVKINFADLLRLLNNIPGNFTIKFLTSHPKDMSNDLINAIAKCEKVSKEIHLPIQSGDNTILKKMNRKYTVGHYIKLIKKIRRKIPDALISTDIIVGFPGETKKQFQNTVKLFNEIKFNKAYINKYSPRFGTAAYNLKDNVPQNEKKQRWKILENIANKKRRAN